MEETTWGQRIQAVTHILTNPTTKPSLYSQFFIGAIIPNYVSWDYPPVYSPTHLRQWWVSQFFKRVSRFGLPDTSWRSNSPYYQPPAAVMAVGVEEGKWGKEERREYARKRLRRKRLVNEVNPYIPLLVPNLLLFTLLLWDPLPE
ncbi:hypothetical protein AtNW77_Chr2g0254411 [Arabidopsis thaliana]|jgi:hypothetical protein|uniref:At2g33855 n=5 Tax=Arabidopsis TaxID=3701 RepID=Q29Q74_ARATH|nr:uncharacterized protein AT2G33855 [Arabidopsis thaliana]KAG7638402.1 hypothetical protein ISN45_At02g028460 [Arabidopsis thaliana x Arabidopsis arenosa]KAG7643019.1 hypothetical protein ISN44_As02g028710 [Arabidopsis suecica]ABD57507.1 At2g33855 [Arabidopsis thaliana]AEC08899.1 transmembrane protein [Arabidopsis thaliana]CAA0374458.1 unnamed protein product [Arabidopsis thaliana]|eukprot:NP_850223.2 transmembrane protein [Arabidopsis thaliana]